jgi:hypothetical protein
MTKYEITKEISRKYNDYWRALCERPKTLYISKNLLMVLRVGENNNALSDILMEFEIVELETQDCIYFGG